MGGCCTYDGHAVSGRNDLPWKKDIVRGISGKEAKNYDGECSVDGQWKLTSRSRELCANVDCLSKNGEHFHRHFVGAICLPYPSPNKPREHHRAR